LRSLSGEPQPGKRIMRNPILLILAAPALFPALCPAAAQQSPAPAPLYDPQQFPAARGIVQQFTLTPRGDIDGLILADGVEVKTPPSLSTQIAYSVRPGDAVVVHGLRAAASPLIAAVSISDESTGRTVIDDGPLGPGRGPTPPAPPPPGPLSDIQGHVRMALHGPAGDLNGALLEDGTIVRLPPPEATRFADLLQPGREIAATGDLSKTAIGTVLDARALGPSRGAMTEAAGPPDRGPGSPPSPPRP
jgi:hypothetical protein